MTNTTPEARRAADSYAPLPLDQPKVRASTDSVWDRDTHTAKDAGPMYYRNDGNKGLKSRGVPC